MAPSNIAAIAKLRGWLTLWFGQWHLFLSALSLIIALLAMLTLVVLITGKGIGYFWPQPAHLLKVQQGTNVATYLGYIYEYADTHHEPRTWLQLDSYHHSRPQAQKLIATESISAVSQPPGIVRVNFYDGRYALVLPEYISAKGERLEYSQFQSSKQQIDQLQAQIQALQLGEIANLHNGIADLKRRGVAVDAPAYLELIQRFEQLQIQLEGLRKQTEAFSLHYRLADNGAASMPLLLVESISYPNQYGMVKKITVAAGTFVDFLTQENRYANQSGGVYPAIFGTVLMVLLMTAIVAPFGIVAAVYLTEYAPNNLVISTIRIAVNNLAGVPSVVYGVFGLGFFVYYLGGNIDAMFYADQLPTPTFGTPGLLWASLTMALLTLPVVIVATEEGLRRVPQGLRHASYALGATKYETIKRVILPVASSSLMTGIVLAIARGAGAVAPMLMVGAVKYAPVLPIDGEFPFIHLERQFMHLGVMIYDGAFHGHATQQSAGFMFAVCFLLLLVVTVLNMVAVIIRARLQSIYRAQLHV